MHISEKLANRWICNLIFFLISCDKLYYSYIFVKLLLDNELGWIPTVPATDINRFRVTNRTPSVRYCDAKWLVKSTEFELGGLFSINMHGMEWKWWSVCGTSSPLRSYLWLSGYSELQSNLRLPPFFPLGQAIQFHPLDSPLIGIQCSSLLFDAFQIVFHNSIRV